MSELPIHPVTGVRAVGIVNGRPVFPILGADLRGDEQTTTRLAQIDERREALRTEIVAFEGRDLDETEAESFRGLLAEWDSLDAERGPLAERAANIERVRSAVVARRGIEHIGTGPEVQRTVNPYEDLERVRSGQLSASDLQSRALAAIEDVSGLDLDDEGRERAERLVRRNDRHGRIARHILLTGSPDYARAFEAVLGGAQPWNLDEDARRALALADEHMRAINEGSGAGGAFLVPFQLDPTIILTNAGSTNPFRQISDVQTIATNAWHGVSSAGVTAGYLGEGIEASDDSPTFAQPELSVVKCAAYLEATFEATQDTNIASSVGMLLADAKDNFEAQEMALGDGGAGHMTGVITGVAAVAGSKVQTATAATFVIGDVWALRNGLKPRWRGNASWVAEQAVYDLIRQFATGSGQQSGSFWVDLNGDTPSKLIGRPTYEASNMDSTVATGKNILAVGDFRRGYKIVDRIGMTVQYEPLVKGPNQRPTGKVGWFAHWRTGAAPIVPDALRVLQVK